MNKAMLKMRLALATMVILGVLFVQAADAEAAAQQYQFTAACYDCHGTNNDIRPIDEPFRNVTSGGLLGNHRTHLAATTNKNVCEKCHTGSNAYLTGHMNDIVEMTSNLNASPVAAKYSKTAGADTFFNWTSNQAGMGTCSNVNCHFEAVTPAWGDAAFTAPGDCDQCHGAPPSGGGSGTAGSHAKHDAYYAGAAQCKKCHGNHTGEATPFAHATSAGQRSLHVLLHDPADVAGGTYSGSGANYLPSQAGSQTFGSCATTYCHSDGKGNYSNPTWGSAASGGCGTCHGAKDNAPPSPASPHAKHVGTAAGYKYTCSRCHSRTTEPTADATTFAAISSVNMHVNKAIDVAFDAVNPSGVWNGTTCSTTYCHSNANPYGGSNTPVAQAWSGTLDCGSCHSEPADGSPTWSAPHTKHVKTYGVNTNFTCNACHAATASDNATVSDPAEHADGTKTLAFSAFANSAATGDIANHQCSNVYCHGDGTSATPTVTVTWSGTLNCNGCHGGSAADAPTSAPHAKHVASSSPYRYSCAKCHSKTAKDTTDATTFATISSYSFHVNKTPDVAFNSFVGAATWTDGTSTCSTTYCHSIGNLNVAAGALPGAYSGSVYAAPTWSGTVGCNACHGRSTAGSGMPDYVSGAAGSATANSHAKHVVGSSLACVQCHEKTTKTGTTIRSTAPSYHVNKTANDVFFNLSGLSASGTYNSGAKTCSTTYCHGTGPSVAWGGSTTCASCHDATNALGGRHDKHYNSATVFWNMTGNDLYTGGAYAYGCKNCHPTTLHATGPAGANNDANIATTGVSKISAYTPGGSSATDARGYSYSVGGTCTTSCHTNGLGGAAVTAVSWTTAPAAGCGTCHNKAGDADPVWSAAHTKHINTYSANVNLTCNACHAGTASSNSAINGASGAAQHPNGTKNIQFNAWVNSSATYPDTATGCSNTYCHSPGTSFATPTHSAVQWDDTVGCGSCHSGGIATGPSYANGTPKANSHAKHVAAGFSCDDCHYATTTNGTAITTPANHVNKAYNVNQGTGINFSYVYDADGGTCSTISCHGDNAATWGGTVNCQDCHTGLTDVDNFTLPFTTASPVAKLKSAEWTATGHGRATASGTYASGNPAANFGIETKACEFCHDSTVGHNASANWFRLKNYSTAAWGRNGPCMVCHAIGSSGVTVGSTTKNGASKVGAYHFGSNHGTSNNGGRFCWDCHDGHGDGNAYMIHTQVAKVADRATGAPTTTTAAVSFTLSSPPAWGDYVKDTTYDGICQACHAGTASPAKVDHFRSDLYDPNHNPGTRCTVCHSHGSSINDAFKPSGNCDLCHGYPPIRKGLAAGTVMAHNNYSSAKFEDYSGGGGAHTVGKHISETARAADGWANCTSCHNGDEAYHTMQTPVRPSTITVDVKDDLKFDYLRSLGAERYTGTLTDKADGAHTNTTGSCSNTNCHFKPSKRWSSDR